MAVANETSKAVEPITELDVLWITAGLGCDGDTIAMTAATQPSIEDSCWDPCPGYPRCVCIIHSSRTRTVMIF